MLRRVRADSPVYTGNRHDGEDNGPPNGNRDGVHEVNDPVGTAAASAANPRRLTVTVLGAFAANTAAAVATGHAAPVPTVHIEHPPAAAATADTAHSLDGAVQMVSNLPVAFGAAPEAAAAASAAMDPTAEAQGAPANAAGSAPGPGHPAGAGAGTQQGTLHVREPSSSTTGSTKSNINEHMDGRESECTKCTFMDARSQSPVHGRR